MNALVRLSGIQASTLHPCGCDLCKYDGALLYDLMVTFYGKNVATSWHYVLGDVMSLL